MLGRTRLPARFPIDTKYVLEGCGPFVRRYIEFPNGRRIQLATRKALSCTCVARQHISIIPDQLVHGHVRYGVIEQTDSGLKTLAGRAKQLF
jgi:hypothetical protein